MTGSLIAIALLAIGLVYTIRSNREIASVNSGHRLPVLYGRYSVAPPKQTLRRRLIGALAILAGAWVLTDVLWDIRPGWALVAFVVTAVAGCLLPPLLITLRHNRARPAAGVRP